MAISAKATRRSSSAHDPQQRSHRPAMHEEPPAAVRLRRQPRSRRGPAQQKRRRLEDDIRKSSPTLLLGTRPTAAQPPVRHARRATRRRAAPPTNLRSRRRQKPGHTFADRQKKAERIPSAPHTITDCRLFRSLDDLLSGNGLAARILLERIGALLAALLDLFGSDLDGLGLGSSRLVRISCARYHRSGSSYNDESINLFHTSNEFKMINRCKYIQ